MSIRKLHYLSGLIISVFVALHLFNHIVSIWGADRHIEMMNTLRTCYRNIFAETVLIMAVLVQIVSGLRLFKTNKKKATTHFDKLHIWTGLYLAFFLVIHVSAILGGRFLLHLDTNFYFGAAGLNTFPFNLFFIPYYALAIVSFLGHIASIHDKKMKQSFLGLSPRTQSNGIIMLSFIICILILYGMTNHFKGVKIPKEYEAVVGK